MANTPERLFLPYKTDWDLHRKGPVDQARHNEKVKEAIKGDLAKIVGEESIITSDGDKLIKVPVRSLDLPRFRHSPGKDPTGIGEGDGDSEVGDVIGRQPGQGKDGGQGRKAGQEPGVDYYEAEMTVDELTELVFADLKLPNLRPKQHQEIESEKVEFNDIRRKGVMSNLDKKRTISENLRRHARAGELAPKVHDISEDDLRYKTWVRAIKKDNNAVVLAMRDVSGSMGEFEKYITRSFYFWMVRFLRAKYDGVKIVFITHHTEAKEVDEDAFFNLGESGGTRVSSAYQLADEIIEERFDPSRWNIYPFHFSDGDNWGEADNQRCVDLIKRMLEKSSAFGYGEIQEGGRKSPSTLMNVYNVIKDPRFISLAITKRDDVYPALRKFFTEKDMEGVVDRR